MWDLIVLFPPNLESLTTTTLTDFLVYFRKIHEKHIRQHIKCKQIIVIYNVDIASKDHMKIFLENVGGKKI